MSTRRPQRDEGAIARLPACPTHLQGEARNEWRRTGRKVLDQLPVPATVGAVEYLESRSRIELIARARIHYHRIG